MAGAIWASGHVPASSVPHGQPNGRVAQVTPHESDAPACRSVFSRRDIERLLRDWEIAPPVAATSDGGRCPRRPLSPGSSFDVLIKTGFVAGLPDRDYGGQRHANVVYVEETRFRRTIEKDDGCELVELVRFEEGRMAKLLTPVDALKIKLGPGGLPLLDEFRRPQPDTGTALLPAGALAAAVLERGAEDVKASAASRAFLADDALAGHAVRAVYRDNVGLMRLEPLGWTIDKPELARYVFALPGQIGCRLLPDPHVASGMSWFVSSDALARFCPRTLPSIPCCDLRVTKLGDVEIDGHTYTELRAAASGPPADGTAGLSAMLRIDHETRQVVDAQLSVPLVRGAISPAELLFEQTFRAPSILMIQYHSTPVS